MKASILIVGHPFPERIEFGADHCTNYDEAMGVLNDHTYSVIVAADRLPRIDHSLIKTSFDFIKAVKKLYEDTQTILISSDASPDELKRVINDAGLFKVIPHFENTSLQLALQEALEEYELIKQNQAFYVLVREQNERLQTLTSLLENKVKAREAYLVMARESLVHATHITESLNRALVAIQKSVTRQEIETQLKDALQTILGLSWIRILFHDQLFLDHMNELQATTTAIFSAPLFRERELLGHIYFAREEGKPFQSDEDDFLLQVSDAVGLAIDRLRALEATESAKQEWDATFDAITEPVAIVTSGFEVLRANKSYAKRANKKLEDVVGNKCHKILFGRETPCPQCNLGTSFDLGELSCSDGTRPHFSVTSHRIEKLEGFALFYRDVGEEERIQRQILESSKMAEIGTIGSSIAHEINNPLGGMIAFLQILKGDLKEEDKMYPDVVEMEQAAMRCKTIVENLLAFTRQSSSEMQVTRLGDLIKIVINIIELQSRGLGITIKKELSDSDVKITADTNQIVQVLVNIMQNSCEAIATRMSSGERKPPGLITLKTFLETPDFLQIEISDNGVGIPHKDLPRVFTPFFTTKDTTKNPGLGLSVSYQIVKEHEGQMEISSVFNQSTSVIVRLKTTKNSKPITNF